jgi:hypothetical protein
MRCLFPVLVLLLLAGLGIPGSAAGTSRIGYLSLDRVEIQLHDGDARVEVAYSLDPGVNLFILLLGSGDLQRKLEQSLNFPGARAGEVGLTHASFFVEGAAENYGDRAYWFPEHRFGVTIPSVKVRAPGYSMTFEDTQSIPRGFGYFGDGP